MSAGVAAKLDHIAMAAESWDELWPRYAGDLGGAWVAGGPTLGFASAQVRYANGMKVEALMPYEWERNDFLRRFLDRRGPGAHHLTFKVPDIEAALAATEAAGYRPIGVDLSDPGWKEAFLHPKDAPGVVIQLAQATDEWESPPPPNFPAPRVPPATLDYVGHAVARLDDGIALYRDLLNGEESARGDDWIEYAWSSGGVIRVFASAALPQGVHHVAFTTVDAAAVRDAKPIDATRTGEPDAHKTSAWLTSSEGASFEVAPEANLGVRLLLRDAAA